MIHLGQRSEPYEIRLLYGLKLTVEPLTTASMALAPAHAARPGTQDPFWRDAQFDTIRLALIKVAGRVTELVTRIRVALPSCYPHQDNLALLAARAGKLPP